MRVQEEVEDGHLSGDKKFQWVTRRLSFFGIG
jgi:hypothetical protein